MNIRVRKMCCESKRYDDCHVQKLVAKKEPELHLLAPFLGQLGSGTHPPIQQASVQE